MSEWISVKDRLPESEGAYIVYTDRGSVFVEHFYPTKRFRDDYIREAAWSHQGKTRVTHWMPLPKPPKEV